MLKDIKSNFDDFTRRHNIKNGVASSKVCETAREVMRTVFSDDGSVGRYKIISFRNGVLNVSVKNSVLSQELKFREKQIIGLVENKVEGVKIKRVKIDYQ